MAAAAPWISTLIAVLTIVGVALGRYPFLRMNRATIAMVGAFALIVTGSLTPLQAYQSVDLNTIALLLSIMILNANFRLCGFFSLVTRQVVRLAGSPRRLLALLITASGGLSALFLNDTIVLVFTPIVLEITRGLRRNPLPYLIALATSANIGSAATVIGNPQNILIGSASGIPFTTFALYLIPVSAVGLLINWVVMLVVYPREFRRENLAPYIPEAARVFRPLLRKSLTAAALMLIALIAGAPTTVAAMGAACLLLITRRLKPERVFAEIDWSLLVFFSGLFVVTGIFQSGGWINRFVNMMNPGGGRELLDLTIFSALLSNLISNVPAVLLLRPAIEAFSQPQMAWLTLAMATTFAGNFTLLGSVANLIVAESARRQGVVMGFKEYLKAGIPVTLLSLAAGVLWLSLF